MILYYGDHQFEYQPSADNRLEGRLILDDAKRELLQKLEDENDRWYLDDDGERWPAEELFSRSPWSWRSPSGRVKLLQRFLDYADGRTWFSTPDTYGGEMFRWMRHPKESPRKPATGRWTNSLAENADEPKPFGLCQIRNSGRVQTNLQPGFLGRYVAWINRFVSECLDE